MFLHVPFAFEYSQPDREHRFPSLAPVSADSAEASARHLYVNADEVDVRKASQIEDAPYVRDVHVEMM